MGRAAPYHPEHVKAAIYQAAKRGDKPSTVHRAMLAGELQGLTGPYTMPLSTVEYYIRQGRKKIAQLTVSKLAAGNPSQAVDYLARQLLTEAELGITQTRAAKQRDPELVKKWADVLKVIAPLVRPDELDDKKKRKPTKPRDPLSDRLMNGTDKHTPDAPSPTPEDKTSEDDSQANEHDTAGATTTPPHTDSPPDHAQHTAGFTHRPAHSARWGEGVQDVGLEPVDQGSAPPLAPDLACPRR